jgi:RecG-like helicase
MTAPQGCPCKAEVGTKGNGGLSTAEKNAVAKRLKEPAPLIAIGTHALFQKNVGFARQSGRSRALSWETSP